MKLNILLDKCIKWPFDRMSITLSLDEEQSFLNLERHFSHSVNRFTFLAI